MTIRQTRALGAALAICFAATARAQITGTWEAREVAFAPWTFRLHADGASLTGTVSQGGANAAGITTGLTGETEIRGGKVDGNRISFQCTAPGGGRIITFAGVVDGETIAFDRSVEVQPGGDRGMNGIYGADGAAHFIAKRIAAPAAAPRPSANSKNASVVILGSGTPVPDPDRSGPCVAIYAGGRAYLVDAGAGVVRRAEQAAAKHNLAGLNALALNTLFITHLHSDHTVGYPDWIFIPATVGRRGPLEVYGPKGIQEMTDHLLAAWKKDIEVRVNGLEREDRDRYKINVHENRPGEIYKDRNVTVTAFLVKHGAWDEAFGYRFDTRERSIVISGDAAPSPSIVQACNSCDVLVHEVYCNAGTSPYFKSAHTSAAELAALAKQAKPKLLVLYHELFNGGCSEEDILHQVERDYSGRVATARDLEIY